MAAKTPELRREINGQRHTEINTGQVAEEVGFEPTVRFHARRFSRPVHSTTLPLLRSGWSSGGLAILEALLRRVCLAAAAAYSLRRERENSPIVFGRLFTRPRKG